MYVWARLARMAATAGRRGPYAIGRESRLSFRCLPTDIDTNVHLNNARYMMLADVGRFDIFLRSGFFGLGRDQGWAPMMGGVQTAFVREIRLWKKFDLVTTIETWDEAQMIGRHVFVLEGGATAAVILTAVGVYDRRRRQFMPLPEVMRALGYGETPPRAPSEAERAFMASHAAMRRLAKGAPRLSA